MAIEAGKHESKEHLERVNADTIIREQLFARKLFSKDILFMTNSPKHQFYYYLLIVFMVIAVYANTLKHGFVWDDTDVILENPQIAQLSNIPAFFFSQDKIETSTGYYRPLANVSFAIDRALWGLNPIGFNLTNLALHLVAAVLFYLVVSAVFNSANLALAATLLFALHPIAGETVNFHAGGRSALLCACFTLLSLLFYTKNKKALSIFCFVGAIFSNEFGLLLVIMLPVYDSFIIKKKVRPTSYALFIVPVICFFVFRSFAVEHTKLITSLNTTRTLWLAPFLIVKYFVQMLYPFNLRVQYDIQTSIYLSAASLIGLIALAGVVYYYRKQKELVFSIWWFLLFLLPVVNIIRLPASSLMADRYAYLSLMGFSLALAFIVCKAKKEAAIALILIICAIFSFVDIKRNGYWNDDFTFFTQMIKDAPDKALGYNNLGIYYYKKNDMVNCEKYLALASTKKDITARLLGSDAGILWETDRLDLAEKLLHQQISIEPSNPQPYMMLKTIYAKQGKIAEAKSYGDKASTIMPGIQEITKKRVVELCAQAEAFIAMRSFDKAEKLLHEALIIDTDFVPALVDLGSVSAEKGNSDKAVEYFSKAIAIEPENTSAHYNLSQVYQEQGKTAEANEELKKYNEANQHQKKSNGAPKQAPDTATPKIH
jgi:tetratricopeptide (TPR) repeat protein